MSSRNLDAILGLAHVFRQHKSVGRDPGVPTLLKSPINVIFGRVSCNPAS